MIFKPEYWMSDYEDGLVKAVKQEVRFYPSFQIFVELKYWALHEVESEASEFFKWITLVTRFSSSRHIARDIWLMASLGKTYHSVVDGHVIDKFL